MKTLYLTENNNIVIDTDNNSADRINRARLAINDAFIIKEPMHVVYGFDGNKKEMDADKGDIVITFYEDSFPNKVIVIKNDQWVENLLEYEKKEQEEKERWAAQKCADCGKCCEG